MYNDNNQLSPQAWIAMIVLGLVFFSFLSNLANMLPLVVFVLIAWFAWRQSQENSARRGTGRDDRRDREGGAWDARQWDRRPRDYSPRDTSPRRERLEMRPPGPPRRPPGYLPDEATQAVPRETSAGRVYKHALTAVQNAGLDVNQLQLLVVDIGVMAFKGSDDPVIHRTWDVPDAVDYIQPFVELRLPTRASGVVRFELVDADGQTIYIHEDRHDLQRGRNLITPSTRLPVHDALATHRAWELRVLADNNLLAVHKFGWEDAEVPAIRQHIGEDGELSSELRAVLAESRLGEMSLDELLAEQDEGGQGSVAQRGRV